MILNIVPEELKDGQALGLVYVLRPLPGGMLQVDAMVRTDLYELRQAVNKCIDDLELPEITAKEERQPLAVIEGGKEVNGRNTAGK